MQTEWNFPICQIVGYKNSGKTTLVNTLTSYFTEQGMKVGTLKHHGHGGEPDAARHTDSYRHTEAGAVISAVQGENELHVLVNEHEKRALNDILPLYTFLPIDLLLLEGYKAADFPKIVLVRDEADLHLPEALTNVLAVGSLNMPELAAEKYRIFSLQDPETFLPYLAALIKGAKK